MSETMEKKPQRVAKEAAVAELQQLFAESQAVILTDYRGITVAEDTLLRNRMREAGVEYRVTKNTLIKLACHQLDIDSLDEFLNGPTAISFANDPVAVAKLVSDFAKEFKKTSVKAGLLDRKAISAAEVDSLAKLPSREVLLARLLGAMQSPLSGFVGCASGMLRQLVTVTDAVRKQKESA